MSRIKIQKKPKIDEHTYLAISNLAYHLRQMIEDHNAEEVMSWLELSSVESAREVMEEIGEALRVAEQEIL